MTKRLPLEWVKDLPSQDKDQFEKSLRHFIQSDVGRRLLKIIDEKLDKATYDSCSYTEGWQFRQAHINGYRQMATEILDLMKFGDTE